jgi:hypothetical protein
MKHIRLAVLAVAALAAPLLLPMRPASADLPSVCAGTENVPAGWVKIDDSWDPSRCGNPGAFTLNVWTITNPAWVPVGGRLNVCAGWRPNDRPPPDSSKWSVRAISWDPAKCGHPATFLENIWTIERVR